MFFKFSGNVPYIIIKKLNTSLIILKSKNLSKKKNKKVFFLKSFPLETLVSPK